jgi:hypothetical protein
MVDITFRPYRDGDEGPINDGFNEVFGLNRSLEEWRWKFPERPEGRWIMLAVGADGRVLAHYAAVAMQVQFGRESVRAGQIVDAYSRKEVRGTRVFSACYERFIEAFGAAASLPLMFGFPGRQHYEMGLKVLKYVLIGSVPYWLRDSGRRASRAGWRFKIREGFDAVAVDDLWRRAAARYDVAAVRDAAWLARRYGGRPSVEYAHLSAWRNGRAHAWGVVCALGGTLRWVELVWDGETDLALVAIDRAVVGLARRLQCTSLELWLGGDPGAERALGSLGWARHPCPQDMLLVARTFEQRVDLDRMQRGFYLTMGDSDLV